MSVANKQQEHTDLPEQVAGLLVPMSKVVLLLPNVSIAEVVGFSDVETIGNKPEWYLGNISWREISIPLVSYEGINGQTIAAINGESRIVIVNGIENNNKLAFYGLVCQGIPRLTRVFPREISQEVRSTCFADHMELTLNGESVVIPALERIDQTILEVL